jgi:hypothetical protein
MVSCVPTELDPKAPPLTRVLRFYTVHGFDTHLQLNLALEGNRKK